MSVAHGLPGGGPLQQRSARWPVSFGVLGVVGIVVLFVTNSHAGSLRPVSSNSLRVEGPDEPLPLPQPDPPSFQPMFGETQVEEAFGALSAQGCTPVATPTYWD